VSGREEKVREKILHMLGTENVYVDDIGNLVAEKGEGECEWMFAAHMDEIGFYITNIRNDGKLLVRKVGGIPDEILPGRHLEIITKNGKIDGLFGCVPPHLTKDGVVFEPVVDVGACNPEEVKKLGIEILDFIVFKKNTSLLNRKLLSIRALDDRAGCFALIEAFRQTKPSGKKIIFAWTVQEEIGLKGAKALAEKYRPKAMIAVDSFACCSPQNSQISLGKGPVLRMIDNSAVASFELMDTVKDKALKEGIPLQTGTTGGGTDGSVFTEKGIKMVPLTLAMKYMHSPSEMIHLDDLANLIRLIVELSNG